MRQAQRRGDFGAAWDAYLRFFRHLDRNTVDMLIFGRCFAEKQCPYFDSLGAYLGKTKREFDTLGSFCPDWQEWWDTSLEGNIKPGTTLENIAYIKGVPQRMLRKGLGGDCEEWRRNTRLMLHEQPVSRDLPTIDVQMRLMDDGRSKLPEVAVRIGPHGVWALVDTGAMQFFLNGEPSDEATWGISRLLPSQTWTVNGWVPAPTVRLARLRLGAAVVANPTGWIVIGRPGRSTAGIGMNVFMHYGAVCFDWRNERLHLGRLGPCANGQEPDNAIISPHFTPYVEAAAKPGREAAKTPRLPTSDSTPYRNWTPPSSSAWVLVDTGATDNHCSKAFAESDAIWEDGRFSFGDGLTAVCTRVGTTVVNDPNFGFSAILGMETLLEFDAFGWELDPFKVYFVPRADDDGNERRDGGR
ncbi:MAG: retropepsin-like aspartic protease [Gammaproteobacteria bacterium]|nr:retropepsin-like aspartic protease [Gammaproteobacteria bacterium]